MRTFSVLFTPVKQVVVELIKADDRRDRNEGVAPDVADLVLNIAFLIAGCRIAKISLSFVLRWISLLLTPSSYNCLMYIFSAILITFPLPPLAKRLCLSAKIVAFYSGADNGSSVAFHLCTFGALFLHFYFTINTLLSLLRAKLFFAKSFAYIMMPLNTNNNNRRIPLVEVSACSAS